MFTYELSNGEKVVSLCPIVLVEFSDWGQFVTAEEVHTSAKNTLEREWEAYSVSHEALFPEAYEGSAIQQAYREHRRAVLALPRPVFVGEEPVPQGPTQGFVPQVEWRTHAAYGGWDLRRSLRHSAIRAARAGDQVVMTEREAWAASSASSGNNSWKGDAVGTFESSVDI